LLQFTFPWGQDAVPPGWVSVTVAVHEVLDPARGFEGVQATCVDVLRGATVNLK
jgi:hypothetical protein